MNGIPEFKHTAKAEKRKRRRNMGRIFYLDAVNGNDENSGITPDAALKSLEASNQILFGAGDKLRGCGRFLGPELSNSKTASILHRTQTP